MSSMSRKVNAAQVARDYANRVNRLAELLLQHFGSLSDDEASTPSGYRQKEACAMTWATAVAALESSDLDKADKDVLVPLILHQHLLPNLQRYFSSYSEMSSFISGRTAAYLKRFDKRNPLETAEGLIMEFLTSIRAAVHTHVDVASTLLPLIGRCIVDDTTLLNTVKAEYGIDVGTSALDQHVAPPRPETIPNETGESKRTRELRLDAFPTMVVGSGTVERGYQIGHFKAQLVSHPRAAGFTEYRFMLVVMGDGRKAKLLVSSERTHTMTGVLLEMAKEQMPELQGTSGREYFLCVTDRTGLYQNYGASPDWENLEAFAQKALQLAQEHLGVKGVIEVYRRRSISRLVPWLVGAAVLGVLIYWAVV